jgi:hypothetical protein
MAESFWDGFRRDPRQREHAGLLAGEADRESARVLLSEGYADGRLDRDELEARVERLSGRLTLGELALLVADLEPTTPPRPTTRPAPDRRPSVAELVVCLASTLACLLVWQITGRGFFWPLWVLVYTGLPVVATLVAGRPPRTSG